jgi:hypothetical protein
MLRSAYIHANIHWLVNSVFGQKKKRYDTQNHRLAHIHDNLCRLVNFVFRQKNNHQHDRDYRAFVTRLHERFFDDAFRIEEATKDNIPCSLIDRKKIVINTRSANDNEITYVCIHFLALMATSRERGRDTTFWWNFKKLLLNAMRLGIYTYVDYAKTPVVIGSIEIHIPILSDGDVVDEFRLVESAKRSFAARRIQRLWDSLLSDPHHAIGRKRLIREFRDMEAGIVPSESYSYHTRRS